MLRVEGRGLGPIKGTRKDVRFLTISNVRVLRQDIHLYERDFCIGTADGSMCLILSRSLSIGYQIE